MIKPVHGLGRCIAVAAAWLVCSIAFAQQPSPLAPATPTPDVETAPPGEEEEAPPSQEPLEERPVPVAALESRGERLRWTWPKVGTAEYLLTGVAAATAVTNIIIGPSNTSATTKLGIDEDVRSAIRLHNYTDRQTALDASDILITFVGSYPILMDSLIVAAWYRKSPEVAAQMILINAEVIAVTVALQSTVNVIVSRERPYGRTCGTQLPELSRDCDSNQRFYSFFSGHTSQAFASAALTCAHHMYLPLYGNRTADTLACVSGMVLAAGTGTLRMLGDMHYFSDVMTGAVIGTLTGFGIPWLFHYRHGPPQRDPEETSASESSFTVHFMPTPNGAGAFGTF